MATQEEEPRLYSKQQRAPVDEVAGEHRIIHNDLERWGRWQRERYQQGTCASLEQNFDSSGGREPSKAIVSLPPEPLLGRIEWTIVQMQVDSTPVDWSGRYLLLSRPRKRPAAVVAAREIGKPPTAEQMPELSENELRRRAQAVVVRVEQLGETLVEFYARREALKTICWKHALQYEQFTAWMFECRATLLRRLS